MKVTTKTAPVKGVGKPDYSRDVASAKERAGLRLEYLQNLRIFSVVFSPEYVVFPRYPWVQPLLAPGDTIHLINNETGVPLPYTIPQGYTLTLIAGCFGVTENVLGWAYLDGLPIIHFGVYPGNNTGYENKVVPLSTAMIDRLGATSHTFDVILKNRGEGDLEGGIEVTCILEAVGTGPLPPVKTVRCPACGHEHAVPNETTQIICPKCDKLFIVYDLSKFKGTA
ncbi:hypothetical protein ES703_17265 [subsurface metagenome]